MSKKGALQLGINTIVVLVIAMMLVGGGIAFLSSIFDTLQSTVGTIDPKLLPVQPTNAEPFVTVGDFKVKGDESEQITVGVYNAEDTQTVKITAGDCVGGTYPSAQGDILQVIALDQEIAQGEVGAYAIEIKKGTKGNDGESYICNIKADGTTGTKKIHLTKQINFKINK